MKDLAKWAWVVLIGILALGYWYFVIIAIIIAAYFLVRWLKPEWLDKV